MLKWDQFFLDQKPNFLTYAAYTIYMHRMKANQMVRVLFPKKQNNPFNKAANE